MDIHEAVERLKEMGLEARIMGEGLLAGRKPDVNDPAFGLAELTDVFVVGQEGRYWIVNMSGVGQLPLIIKRSIHLQETIESVCGFFLLKSQYADESKRIQHTIWSLQRLGLAAEIEANGEIRIRCSRMKQVDDTYEFMVNLPEEDLLNSPCEFMLRWTGAENNWLIITLKAGRTSEKYHASTLTEAVDLIKNLRDQISGA